MRFRTPKERIAYIDGYERSFERFNQYLEDKSLDEARKLMVVLVEFLKDIRNELIEKEGDKKCQYDNKDCSKDGWFCDGCDRKKELLSKEKYEEWRKEIDAE